MSLEAAAIGLLLVDAGDGRRVALALTRAARIEKVEARHPAAGRSPEVAAAAGRIIAARSLSAALGWPDAPEPLALDFGDGCLLLPGALSVTYAARVESAGRGAARRFWWRAPDGAIVQVFDSAALAEIGGADARHDEDTSKNKGLS